MLGKDWAEKTSVGVDLETEKLTVAEPDPPAFVAVTRKLKAPAAVGVAVNTPLAKLAGPGEATIHENP